MHGIKQQLGSLFHRHERIYLAMRYDGRVMPIPERSMRGGDLLGLADGPQGLVKRLLQW